MHLSGNEDLDFVQAQGAHERLISKKTPPVFPAGSFLRRIMFIMRIFVICSSISD